MSRSFKILIAVLIVFVVIARIGYKQHKGRTPPTNILQAHISIEPLAPIPNEPKTKVQPGTSVKISLTVENKGTQTIPPGDIFVRYAFPPPLHNEPASVLFQTEMIPLPALQPHKSITVTFSKPHQWPSLIDFVRYDWPMREYQAIFALGQNYTTISTMAITYSAYYYPGLKKESPISLE